MVHRLTPENVDKYTIFDVVLPLPGYSVTFPQYFVVSLPVPRYPCFL